MNNESITNPRIEDYCRAHSSPTSPLLQELYEYTKKNVRIPEMITGPLVSAFLKSIVRIVQPKRVLEIGCYTGYSALSMAEELRDGAELVTLDVSEEFTSVARQFWARSPHAQKIRLILGDAKESLRALEGSFDLVLIDADKEGYPLYLERALPKLTPTGVILLDNCLRDGRVLQVPAPDVGTKAIQEVNTFLSKNTELHVVLVPIRDGIFMVQKK